MAKLEIEALQPQSGSNPSSTTTEGFSQRIKVLVTGGLGFVGSAIVRALQEQHPEWVVCILDAAEDPRGLPEYQDDDFGLLRGCSYEYVQADITNQMDVRKAFERTKPDAVVHSAGMVPPLSERYLGPFRSVFSACTSTSATAALKITTIGLS
jgi:NAD(P)-dependent dehydrogenase (short-subunit alcohol dehydrogenase family)